MVVSQDDSTALASSPHGAPHTDSAAPTARTRPPPDRHHREIIMTSSKRVPPFARFIQVLLADRRASPHLRAAERAPRPAGGVAVAAARGVSCDDTCARHAKGGGGGALRCRDAWLPFVNDCGALRSAFACEAGCGHQVGISGAGGGVGFDRRGHAEWKPSRAAS